MPCLYVVKSKSHRGSSVKICIKPASVEITKPFVSRVSFSINSKEVLYFPPKPGQVWKPTNVNNRCGGSLRAIVQVYIALLYTEVTLTLGQTHFVG